MWAFRVPMSTALTLARARRGIICPNAGFLAQLMEWEAYLLQPLRAPTSRPSSPRAGSPSAALSSCSSQRPALPAHAHFDVRRVRMPTVEATPPPYGVYPVRGADHKPVAFAGVLPADGVAVVRVPILPAQLEAWAPYRYTVATTPLGAPVAYVVWVGAAAQSPQAAAEVRIARCASSLCVACRMLCRVSCHMSPL
jgi:hypothetical protein